MKRRSQILLAGFVFALALAGTALWLLASESGLRFALARVQAAVPGLAVGRVHGRIMGAVTIEGLRIDRPSFRLRADRLLADLNALDLLNARFHFRSLYVQGLSVTTRPAGRSAESPTNTVLPDLSIKALRVEDARLTTADGNEYDVGNLTGVLSAHGQRITLSEMQMRGSLGEASGRVTIDLSEPWWIDQARLEFSAEPRAQLRLRGRLQSPGDAREPHLGLQLDQPVRAALDLYPGADREHFAVRLTLPSQSAEGLGLTADQTIAARLELSHAAGEWQVDGAITLGDQPFVIDGGRIHWDEGRVRIAALALDLPESGRVVIDGELPLSTDADLTLRLHSERLRIPSADGVPWQLAGDLSIDGNWQQLSLHPALLVRRGDWPELKVEGNLLQTATAWQLMPLRLQGDGGDLRIHGQIERGADGKSTLEAELSDFNPGLLWPDWPGRLQGSARWQGPLFGESAAGSLQLRQTKGRLRGQPLGLEGDLQFLDRHLIQANLDARLGANSLRIQGDLAGSGAIDLALDAPALDELSPELGGALRLKLNRDREWRILASGSALHWRDQSLDQFSLRGQLPVDKTDVQTELRGRLSGLRLGAFEIASAQVSAEGRIDQHRIEAQVQQKNAALHLGLQGAWSGDGWRGQVAAAELHLANAESLHLAVPSELELGSGRLRLSESCIDQGAAGRACFSIEHTAANTELKLSLAQLAIDRLTHLLPWGEQPALHGRIDAEARLVWRQGQLVEASTRFDAGGLALTTPGREELRQRLEPVSGKLDFSAGRGRVSLHSGLLPQGGLHSELDLRVSESGSLTIDGDIELATSDLSFLDLFDVELAHPSGQLSGRVHLSGPWQRPEISGELRLNEFAAELPQLGLQVQQGVLSLVGQADAVALEGSLQSGEGVLHLAGKYQPGADPAMTLRVYGDRVEIADTSSIHLVASPDVQLRRDRDAWRWQGRIEVTDARIDAERLAPVSTLSPDVVVIDGPDVPAIATTAWRADLELVLGDHVSVQGYGFDGKLGGRLQLSQQSASAALASGQLEVTGDYRAYGQKLRIERGRLTYAGSSLDEPSLNLRAERRIGASTVGLQISGTARRPLSQVYSNPALPESDALALLVTGRPLNQVRSSEQGRLSRAAMAVGSIGGDMLAGSIGLDELRLGSDDTLQGEAFAVGKFLSPRLYVGYAVALLTRGEVFTVRYLISKHLDIEAHASERNRLLLNYRIGH